HYWLTKNRIWESVALLLVAFTLLRPGFWWDMVFPPLQEEPPVKLEQMIEGMDPGSQLIIEVQGENLKGKLFTKTVMLNVGDESTGAERLTGIGLETRNEDDKILIDNVVFASLAEKAGIDFDQEILNIKVPTERPPKQLMFIPALALAALIWFVQRGRKKRLEARTVAMA
ncbi:MAG: DUF3394 domain-containing protein, partial [Desulfobacterales bacterium]